MKTRVLSHLIAITLIYFFNSSVLFAQQLLREIPLQQQIENSSLVVEGEVISKKAFKSLDGNIYTTNTVEIYKVFKGEPITHVDVITKGGTIGMECQIITPSLKLRKGDLGVFTLYDSDIPKSNKDKVANKSFKVYSSLQGFYKYNLYDDTVTNTLNGKKGISNVFYKEIITLTKSNYKNLNSFDVEKRISKSSLNKRLLIPTGIVFSPTSVSAGTKSTITITIAGGATGNFGSTQGKVSFRDADSGGNDGPPAFNPVYVDALDTQILNWSTTSITVEVPSEAGTGDIRITDASSNVIVSSSDLTVTHAEINVTFEVPQGSGTIYAFPTRHVDNDGSGGYVLQMETSFDADIEESGAKAAFLSALETWRCETGINFTIGAVSPIDVANTSDGTNIVRFDNGNELDSGTLGQTSYRFLGCGGATLASIQAFPEEIDIVFDDGETWYYGGVNPGPGFEIDFESVALHELGHAHQLGHVIDTNNDVMHFNLGLGELLRDLSPNNITAANNVQSRSESSVPAFSCFSGKSSMSSHACSLSIEDEELNKAIGLYPNPAQSIFYIKNNSFINLEKAVIYDLSGRLINEYDISNASRTKSIDVTGVSKGIYFVNIHSERAMITRKMILD
ncbi:T9SS type A sorting domain-containing protein [Flavivirga amylovorans]|uniref:T9SS type A sorting domain-containing protein n=1 Tax=Flavivirga amylovorans TaxID=870486 RepID=A0ABT8X015_9FLAO|nr:T9SS type A sorting domain-containing protein [Flavivirga amylovorans]MDO5987222.1 T9SS type A sorting domain-containing protein [Flavivirga amylovorans]